MNPLDLMGRDDRATCVMATGVAEELERQQVEASVTIGVHRNQFSVLVSLPVTDDGQTHDWYLTTRMVGNKVGDIYATWPDLWQSGDYFQSITELVGQMVDYQAETVKAYAEDDGD